MNGNGLSVVECHQRAIEQTIKEAEEDYEMITVIIIIIITATVTITTTTNATATNTVTATSVIHHYVISTITSLVKQLLVTLQ